MSSAHLPELCPQLYNWAFFFFPIILTPFVQLSEFTQTLQVLKSKVGIFRIKKGN